MNGKRYFLDTNAIIALLNGNQNINTLLNNADYIACSIISILEFLSFPSIQDHDKNIFMSFIKRIDVISLNLSDLNLLEAVTEIRKQRKLKLPDAIILASAKHKNSTLLTSDVVLLKIKNLDTQNYF